MNEQIERHLEAESTSGSRGYVTDRPASRLVVADGDDMPSGINEALARWLASNIDTDVAVTPLAGVTELLDLAKSREGRSS